ncbi:hypothetical protein BDZ90DRAFT_278486 [Jaminaea rosea]|uniref:Myb-like domain-containing protein n=1 Tax=Jaminaea rosea TaxID=1569628 RepID=A0A316UUW8_9BASI|nr:hypothetical protein BDZ90DRAFT_278486 [Jaminaea rosea]PWN29097.1 hypothetical protein BDZ90DRAFT_278486 [Jaminaea rosea]
MSETDSDKYEPSNQAYSDDNESDEGEEYDDNDAVGASSKKPQKSMSRSSKKVKDESDWEDEESGKPTPQKKRKKRVKTGQSNSSNGEAGSGKAKSWTSQQRLVLFKAMLGSPSKTQCNDVAAQISKSPSQCYDQWRRFLLPFIIRKIEESQG